VTDLNPGTVPWNSSHTSAFQDFTRLGDRVLFTGFIVDDVQCPLWITDGLAAGTERVADLCAGSLDRSDLSARILAVSGRIAFLSGPGRQLWRSDGTAAGTFPLGVEVADDSGNTLLGPGGILYFAACTPAGDCEPWRSDGTRAGTRLLRAVQAGAPGFFRFIQFVVDGDRVVFSAVGKRGPALWRTDGTPRGTRELVRLPSPVGHLLAVDGALYVSASGYDSSGVWLVPPGRRTARRLGSFPTDRHSTGVELFQAGGQLLLRVHEEDGIADLWEITAFPFQNFRNRPRFLAQFPGGLGPIAEVGGGLVLAASADYTDPILSLWFLGPGMSHPQPVSGCPGGCPHLDSNEAGFGVLGGRLLFAGRDDQHGSELWETDGTGPGTRLVHDLCPGVCDGFHGGFTPALGRLLFTAGERDLWVTDGTAAGTLQLGRIPSPDDRLDLAVANGRVIFNGFDDVAGSQPWVSDLTAAGTAPLLTLGGGLAAGATLQSPTPSGSGLLFGACDPGMGLWSSDGTAAGTVHLLGSDQVCGSSFFGSIVRIAGLSCFSFEGARLWCSDGTPGGTLLLASWNPPRFRGSAALDGELFFILDPEESAGGPPWVWSFWRSDGTPQGTVQTGTVPLGGTPDLLGTMGSDVFFVAQRSEPPFAYALWRTDGTEAGTRALVDLAPGFWPSNLVRLGDRTFFVLTGAERQTEELWSTDGTAAGTVPVIAGPDAPRPLNPRALAAFHGVLYFYAETGDAARPGALWRSDGTAAGTRIVADFAPPSAPDLRVSPALTPAGDLLFFRLDDGVHGEELWRTDGTAAGTVLVRDLAPGPAHARPDVLTAAGGRLYFAATDGGHGLELWVSDGTAAGTRMVQDVLPGLASSSPQDLVASDGNLFFTADDGEHGRELWVLPLTP
jgi:ELWxxDGT repeat protein